MNLDSYIFDITYLLNWTADHHASRKAGPKASCWLNSLTALSSEIFSFYPVLSNYLGFEYDLKPILLGTKVWEESFYYMHKNFH
jgi:hypothetical protein